MLNYTEYKQFPPSLLLKKQKKLRSSMDFWADPFDQKRQARKIKVFARFRPMNLMEQELSESQFGGKSCIFPTVDTVVIKPENHIFTMDLVLRPESSQEEVFEYVGRQTVSDVLNGYNGTIFTYGQTGSGKTYTLVGDIKSFTSKGIIIRAIEQIFDHIQNSEIGIDYVIICSILEIYKETLIDLLRDGDQDLKIKESPTKGIYVDGLTKISVVSQEELFQIIEQGNQMKTVAQTRYNSQSSRSHTIFQIEIEQIFPNDTQKFGKLNLIDLAGSEKVSKTHVIGGRLEEAKKINLSLTYLGNCIHALTKKNSHIPYRDSKLTRMLQESLGGNFKTSLIVTCSNHSSCVNETISSLNFAKRAKHIKNYVKMNIKNSREKMSYIIQQLKLDVIFARNQYKMYREFVEQKFPRELAVSIHSEFDQISQWDQRLNEQKLGQEGNRSDIRRRKNKKKKKGQNQKSLYQALSQREVRHETQQSWTPLTQAQKMQFCQDHKRTKSAQAELPIQFQGLKRAFSSHTPSYDSEITVQNSKNRKGKNIQEIDQIVELKAEDSQFRRQQRNRKTQKKKMQRSVSNIDENSKQKKIQTRGVKNLMNALKESNQNFAQIILEKDILQLKLNQSEALQKKTMKENLKKDKKITKLENKIFEIKSINKKSLMYDNKISDLKNQMDLLQLKYDYYKTKNDQLLFELKIIQQQISFLENKLKKSQTFACRILKEKSTYLNITVQKLFQKELQFYEINLTDYFNSSFNFSFEPSFQNKASYKQKKSLTPTTSKQQHKFYLTQTSWLQGQNLSSKCELVYLQIKYWKNIFPGTKCTIILYYQNIFKSKYPDFDFCHNPQHNSYLDTTEDKKLGSFLLLLKHQLIQQQENRYIIYF